jgi:hypothetical protein
VCSSCLVLFICFPRCFCSIQSTWKLN